MNTQTDLQAFLTARRLMRSQFTQCSALKLFQIIKWEHRPTANTVKQTALTI
jgi:hypothetical protein